LPLLGDTPRFNGSKATADEYNLLSTEFNAALADALDALELA
jgi:hypothetical protein